MPKRLFDQFSQLPTKSARARARRKARGCCSYCSQPKAAGFELCQYHIDYTRQCQRKDKQGVVETEEIVLAAKDPSSYPLEVTTPAAWRSRLKLRKSVLSVY